MIIKCKLCGTEIFPEEVYYTMCLHTEMKDAKTDDIRILDMQPLEFRCKFCAERGAAVC